MTLSGQGKLAVCLVWVAISPCHSSEISSTLSSEPDFNIRTHLLLWCVTILVDLYNRVFSDTLVKYGVEEPSSITSYSSHL